MGKWFYLTGKLALRLIVWKGANFKFQMLFEWIGIGWIRIYCVKYPVFKNSLKKEKRAQWTKFVYFTMFWDGFQDVTNNTIREEYYGVGRGGRWINGLKWTCDMNVYVVRVNWRMACHPLAISQIANLY